MKYKSMIELSKSSRLPAIALIFLALCALGLVACSASTETKQGAQGEYCQNRDSDCRVGLVCQNSVCTSANPAISEACRQSCEKIESCALDDFNCLNECSETLKNWSDSVIEQFAGCIVDDLACSELGATDNEAAQICYDQLEVDPQRLDRCRQFRTDLIDCEPADYNTTEFESRCLRMARTTDDTTWARTNTCAQTDDCTDTVACINEVFGLKKSAN